jgi:hypothetical protein
LCTGRSKQHYAQHQRCFQGPTKTNCDVIHF